MTVMTVYMAAENMTCRASAIFNIWVLKELHTGATTMKKYWMTKKITRYGSCFDDSVRQIYPTISMSVPTAIVEKYQVLYFQRRALWAKNATTNNMTPRRQSANDGMYLLDQVSLEASTQGFWRCCLPIDDDARIVRTVRVGEVRVDVTTCNGPLIALLCSLCWCGHCF